MALQDASLHGSDKIANSTVNQCFNDMIEKTNLDCSVGVMNLIGHQTMVNRGNELGLAHTTFASDRTATSASDQMLFLNKLYKSLVAPTAGGSRILSTMQNTRMRDGIPAGIAKGTVSNLAGEGSTVHNDTAVVYSPKGTYILVILSEGSSRDNIADLTRKVEALHQVLPPKPKNG